MPGARAAMAGTASWRQARAAERAVAVTAATAAAMETKHTQPSAFASAAWLPLANGKPRPPQANGTGTPAPPLQSRRGPAPASSLTCGAPSVLEGGVTNETQKTRGLAEPEGLIWL